MSAPLHVAILGASGYGAAELLRLLAAHPAARVVSITSTSKAGELVSRVHPHLAGFYDQLRIGELVDLAALRDARQRVIFSALPHATSGATIQRLCSGPDPCDAPLIDLSGDLRLSDPEQHARHYPESPALPELRQRAVYGLPELFASQIRSARLVANPGCLATASILAAAPLVRGRDAGREPLAGAEPLALAVDAKTGSSGSGRTLKETTHHPTRHADFRAYKPLAHQHEPEILQALGDPAGARIAMSFVAQSIDAARGIFVTVHATLPRPIESRAAREHFARYYADCPFVRIRDDSPTLQDVVGSNFCDIGVAARGRQIIVMAALDNLVKGMAGTAIQNMNLICGLPQETGLWWPSFRPV
ncbi:MAG: N-acetyl-gamma-glutamyl-phosphate reductase [Phycisphaerae bacterium]|nr:N-acetyl-gamma-glutamyl-phosphate reductase [Phycisphaerae bacterium]